MKKFLCSVFGLVAVFALLSQSADARRRHQESGYPHIVIGPFDLGDARIVVAGVVAGGAMTGTYFAIRNTRSLRIGADTGSFSTGAFALTTVGCMTLAPMIASAWVWNTEGRYLSQREALGLGAGCIIPVIGPIISDAVFFGGPEH